MVAGTVPVGKTPHWVAASSDGKRAYVSNEGSNDVSVVDLTARTVIARSPRIRSVTNRHVGSHVFD